LGLARLEIIRPDLKGSQSLATSWSGWVVVDVDLVVGAVGVPDGVEDPDGHGLLHMFPDGWAEEVDAEVEAAAFEGAADGAGIDRWREQRGEAAGDAGAELVEAFVGGQFDAGDDVVVDPDGDPGLERVEGLAPLLGHRDAGPDGAADADLVAGRAGLDPVADHQRGVDAVVDRAGAGLSDSRAREARAIGTEAAVNTVTGSPQGVDRLVGGMPVILHHQDIKRLGHGKIIRPTTLPAEGHSVGSPPGPSALPAPPPLPDAGA